MEVVLFGTSKVAQSVFSYAQEENPFQVAGFCVDREYYDGPDFMGLPLVPFDEVEKRFPPQRYQMLVAVGYHDLNRLRERRCLESEAKGYTLCSYISPHARIASNVRLGKNCIIMAQVSIEPFAQVGDNVCVFNSSVHR